MNNLELLKKYRKKLSIYFALFLLFTYWFLEWVYFVSKYLTYENNFEKSLIKSWKSVENILKNSETYAEKLKNKDETLEKIISRTLKEVLIYKDNTIIYSDFWDNYTDYIGFDESFKNVDTYKVYHFLYNSKDSEYRIYIKRDRWYCYKTYLQDYLYFMIFSLAFFIIFYFIGYYFVAKNLRPIKESIDNLESFIWNINHEFKTPLSEIISSLELSKTTWISKDLVYQISDSAKRLDKILDSLVEIVEVWDNSSFKKQKLDIVWEIGFIISILEPYALSKSIKIVFKSDLDSYFLRVNKEHFHISFSNLLKNAIKYSPENKKIEVYLWNDILRIKDEWVWIEEKNLEKVFSRFFRENYIDEKWAWIWLSLVKKISDIYNWKIDIKSSRSKWTTIFIIF